MSDSLQRQSGGQMVSHQEPLRCVAVNFFLLAQTHFFLLLHHDGNTSQRPTYTWFHLLLTLIIACLGVCIHWSSVICPQKQRFAFGLQHEDLRTHFHISCHTQR